MKKTKTKPPEEITLPMIQKLALAPGDILLVTLGANGQSTFVNQRRLRTVGHLIPRNLPRQRFFVKMADVAMERLADIITVEEIHALLAAKDKQLLATPANVLQVPAGNNLKKKKS